MIELSTLRPLRSLLSVPFQSRIRASMLLHAARRACSTLFGELATRFSSSSRPVGAMAVAIEFDVPIDVVDEITQAIVVVLGAVERVEKPAEHLRDDVLAAEKKAAKTSSVEPELASAIVCATKVCTWSGAPIRARAISTGTPTNTSERNFSNWRVLAPTSRMARR